MKLKIVLIASGYCLIIGTSFSISWEHGLGAAALLGTIHSIAALFKKHGQVVVLPVPPKTTARGKQKTAKTTAKEDATELAGINKDIFKQFQNNLQDHQKNLRPQATQTSAKPAVKMSQSPAPHPYTQAQPAFDETLPLESEDKVSLTAKPPPAPRKKSSAKTAAPRPAAKPSAAKPTKPAENASQILLKKLSQPLDEVGEDLFDDVQIILPSEQNSSANSPPPAASQPLDLFDEGLSETLQASHSMEEKSAEADALLKMAQASFQAGRVSEAKASLDNFFSIQKELKVPTTWEIQYLYAQVCLRLGDRTTAFAYFSEMTQNGLGTTHPDYAKILESIAASLEEHMLYEGALSFLYDLLNYYRQQLDRAQMDQIYGRIELALEELEDDERLIRAYKNHLEIKRILKDQYGESRLLDALGNRYYKMGDKELSRKCYEENLHLKALMHKVESP